MTTISPQDWERISELVGEAIALAPEERHKFLDEVELQNPLWKNEIASLLKHVSPHSDFLEKPAMSLLSSGEIAGTVASLTEGDRIDDFEIHERLGEGAFASVYRARQISLGRDVALKVSRNMGHEARTMASLEHANIVQVFSESIDENRNVRYLCMQFIPGLTLEYILKELEKRKEALSGNAILAMIEASLPSKQLLFDRTILKERELLQGLNSFETVLWLGNQLSRALSFAHSRGVLHLDVKPSNILISGYGRALLSDFNVSVNRQIDTQTAPVVLGGTLNYMSTEHKRAFLNSAESIQSLDHRADIYSLGVVLREVMKVASVENEPRLAVESLELFLNECTKEDPQFRIQNAKELEKRLLACSEYRGILNQLPRGRFYDPFAERYPNAVYILGVLIPQVLGSVINIFYNESRIVSHLNEEQQHFFIQLIKVWNPLIYLACIAVLVMIKRPILRFMHSPETAYAEGTLRLRELRALILRFPFWVAAITSLAWGFASLMFPISIGLFHPPVNAPIFWHFQLSFFLSWLIATTYSFTNTHYFGLRTLYPKLWVGCIDIRKEAKQELAHVGRRVRPLHLLAGLIPLIGTALMVVVGPETLQGHTYKVFQLLLLVFVVIAAGGLFYAVLATKTLSETLFALTGNEIVEKDD